MILLGISKISGATRGYLSISSKKNRGYDKFAVSFNNMQEQLSCTKKISAVSPHHTPTLLAQKCYDRLKEQFPNLTITYNEFEDTLNIYKSIDIRSEKDIDKLLNTLVSQDILSQKDYENSKTIVESPLLLNKIQPASYSSNYTYKEMLEEGIQFEKRQIEMMAQLYGKNGNLLAPLQEHLDSLERTSSTLNLFLDFLQV